MKNETPCNVLFKYFIIILRVLHFRWSEFLFCAETLCWGAVSFFFLQLLEHHAVCLEDLFELLNNFNTPLIQEVFITFWNVLEISGIIFIFIIRDPTKFRNRD
jgi:hypothetical protein